ncbi:hypothetical protein PR048_009846 [Dryococelus australis]|uniref:DDE Tnp4 domain-containing protein n=1 Tax=Dryococelus australis TaxID=614101 RepID=A0ABQ9I115_9NEOP|nr:hypothetical protein PR048_009846 [Dryococelus australis]
MSKSTISLFEPEVCEALIELLNNSIKDGSSTAECLDNSTLKQKLEDSNLNVHTSSCLPGGNFPVPYVLLADDAFPLRPSIMKPFLAAHDQRSNERIYNYRHCARRVVEND